MSRRKPSPKPTPPPVSITIKAVKRLSYDFNEIKPTRRDPVKEYG